MEKLKLLSVAALMFVGLCFGGCHDEERHAPERVHQSPDDGDDKDEPEIEPADVVAAQLADASLRIVGGGVSLRYSSPGTIFTLSSDGCELHAVSLANGMEASVAAPQSLADCRVADEHEIVSGYKLSINGTEMPLHRAELMRSDDNALWIRFVTSDGAVVWAVIVREF